MVHVPPPATASTHPHWNKLEIWSFVLPFATLVMVRALGYTLLGNDLGASSVAPDKLGSAIASTLVSIVIDTLGYSAAVVTGHMSLRPRYGELRGRGLGLTGLILGYVGLALTVLALVWLIALPTLFHAAS